MDEDKDLHKRLLQTACMMAIMVVANVLVQRLGAPLRAACPTMPEDALHALEVLQGLAAAGVCGVTLYPLFALLDWYRKRKKKG